MTSRKLATAVAAASLAGASVLGMAAPAFAQTGSLTPVPRTASSTNVVAGQSVTLNSGSGSFTPGAQVQVQIACLGIDSGGVANATGNVAFTFTVPAGTSPRSCSAIFTGPLAGARTVVTIPFRILPAAAATGTTTSTAARTSARSLPRTGSDQMVPLAITGLALVGVGAGIVVASRRRREDLPGGIA